MDTLIRPEKAADIPAIHRVHRAAFPGPGEAAVVDALRSSEHLAVSLVAESSEAGIIGPIAFSPVRLEGGTEGIGLAPLAVLPAFQRRGIGGKLVQAGLIACRETERPFVVVLGDPDYYCRFGFVPASRWNLSDEYDGGAAFQAMELQPTSIPAGGGLVRYGAEFSIFGQV